MKLILIFIFITNLYSYSHIDKNNFFNGKLVLKNNNSCVHYICNKNVLITNKTPIYKDKTLFKYKIKKNELSIVTMNNNKNEKFKIVDRISQNCFKIHKKSNKKIPIYKQNTLICKY